MTAKLVNLIVQDELKHVREQQYALDQFALTAVLLPAGLFISTNDKLLRVAGYDRSELHHNPFHDFLAEEFRKLFTDHVLPLLNRGIPWRGELCHVARNQNLFWTESTIVPILDGTRTVTHLHFIGFEITERKAVEKALMNNSIFFTRLMDMAPIGFFLADAVGSCTYINKVWSDTSGCRLRCALGEGWLRALHPEDRDRVVQAWQAFVQERQPFCCEYRYQRPDGRSVWVLATAEAMDFAPDARTQFIRVEQDLTERKEHELLINEQRAQMVAASKMSALGEMAGGIAHEINNPLAILQLCSRQILRLVRTEANPNPRLVETAENIRHTTDRIASIIRSLRAISRDGHSDPFMPTPLRTLIDDCLELCAARFQSHSITLTVAAFDPALTVWCRPVEILQILLNVLNNAFSALEALEEKWIEIGILDRDLFVDIEVTDSGRGIAPEYHDKLFLPFFTTKPIGSGTGLGLSISKAVALDHHGDLWLDSSSPYTRFVLRLPKSPGGQS
ncbi:MAG TPA: PAS domain-containing protein [Oligoflexus sp.]|uniref:PAS domain-containing sensor histidine kinase n=1 Tax=Oligoflexus sp. TaxID=1971216 RepID=UPI002D7F36B8|nr:PAS domain-containing protein [Oligoflexus sp.]HET9239258.1 PAS domain-containing protein [Oligoflexus sp.]